MYMTLLLFYVQVIRGDRLDRLDTFYSHQWSEYAHWWCSVQMPIVIVNFRLRGIKQDSALYVVKVILTHIPVEFGIVDLYVYRFLNDSG